MKKYQFLILLFALAPTIVTLNTGKPSSVSINKKVKKNKKKKKVQKKKKKRKKPKTAKKSKKSKKFVKNKPVEKKINLPDYLKNLGEEIVSGSEWFHFTRHLLLVFESVIEERLMPSLRKSAPLLDQESRKSLFFNGNDPKFNLYNSFCKEFHLPVVGLSHLIASFRLGSVNNDIEKRSLFQNRLRALKSSSNKLHKLRNSFEGLEEHSTNMVLFFLTNSEYSSFMDNLKAFLYPEKVWPEHVKQLEMFVTGKKESVIGKGIESIDVSAIRILNVEVRLLEILTDIHRRLTTTKQLLNSTVLRLCNAFISNADNKIPYFVVNVGGSATNINDQGIGSVVIGATMWDMVVSLPYSFINHCKQIYGASTLGKKLFHLVTMPFSILLGSYDLKNERGPISYFLNLVFYNLMGFMTDTGFIYDNIKSIKRLYKGFKAVTTQAQQTIWSIEIYRRTIAQSLVVLEKDPEMKKLFQKDIKLFKLFLDSKLAKIIKSASKDCSQAITMGEIVNFFNRKSFRILKNYRKAAKLSEKQHYLLKKTVLALHELDVLLSISYKLRLAEQDITDRKICIPEKPKNKNFAVIEYNNGYNIRLGSHVTKNSFKSKGRGKNSQIIMGGNGGGKTISLEGSVAGVVFHQSYGWFPSQSAKLSSFDFIHFSRNIGDNTRKGLSLMQSEIKNLFQALAKMGDGKKSGLIGIDEPNKGTPQSEGGALLVSVLKRLLYKYPKNFAIVTTHFTDLPKIAERMNYKGLDFYTTEFTKEKGFTFKILPGLPYTPACVHLVEKQSFHPQVFKDFIYLLKSDPGYRSDFKSMLPVEENDTLYGFIKWFLLFLLLMAVAILLLIKKYRKEWIDRAVKKLGAYLKKKKT